MTRCCISSLFCLTVLVVSCGKPARPSGGSSTTTMPTCEIEAIREFELDSGTTMRMWNLKATGLKKLTIRLIVAIDGKAQISSEIEYKWEHWEPTIPAATGQIVLVIEDGKAFGAKEKRLPLLGLDIANSPDHIRNESRKDLILEGKWYERMSSSMTPQPLSEKAVLYSKLFLPNGNTASKYEMLGSDAEAVAAASNGGQALIAVLTEWEPQ